LSIALSLILVTPAEARDIRIALIDSGADNYINQSVSFTSSPADRDFLNHGSLVARLVREQNPKAHIVMLQVCEAVNGRWRPSTDAVRQAIQWAMDNDINIINMSLNMVYDEIVDKLIHQAVRQHGIQFIAAGRNLSITTRFVFDEKGYVYKKNLSNQSIPFPASHPDVISVGMTETQDQPRWLDMYASGSVSGKNGTSFATARVTAQLAHQFKFKTDSAEDLSIDKNR
jgi:hypothetical protein